MKTLLQRFAGWGTGSPSNLFQRARIKLTALYLLIIVLTLGVYSTVMYFSVLQTIQAEALIDAVQLKIFIIDSSIFVIAAIGSYWLAGITLRPIKKSLEAQEAFSSDASHELRTPLAVMKTGIEVALRGNQDIPDEIQKLLRSNLEEIQKLTSLTTDLLELARGKEKILTAVSIDDLVHDEVVVLQPLAHEKDITMTVAGSTTGTVMADEITLRRVMKNIIANAITYTNTGGTVTVTLKEKGKTIIIAITDTGIGMNQHDLAHVFKRFYKADTAHGTQGSGLGLAIVKHIVEHHHGTIDISSVVNEGTTVTIALPTV